MVAAFKNAQQAYGRPLIFTEIGYRSGDGANRAPWDWGVSLPVRHRASRPTATAAMYEVWSRESLVDEGAVLVVVGRLPRRARATPATTRAASRPRTCCGWQK